MTKRILCGFLLTATLTAFFCASAVAQSRQKYVGIAQAGALPVGTEEPCISNQCLFYSGDFDASGPNPNGLWNGVNSVLGATIDGTIYTPFQVPKKFKGAKGKTDWNVQGLFINSLFGDAGLGISVSSVNWSIVQGVASGGNPSGGQVKTICSGSGTPSPLVATGRNLFGFYFEYTVLVTGVACPTLEAGVYWMTVVPTTVAIPYLSDVEDNTPANAQGPGISVQDDSFWTSTYFGFSNFDLTTSACGNIGCDNFSVGVVGTATH